jgi:hypothetical protein
MSGLTRCESCGAPNAAVATSCSTCGVPRVQAKSVDSSGRNPSGGGYGSGVPRPNIYTADRSSVSQAQPQQVPLQPQSFQPGRIASSSVDSYALGSSASARVVPNGGAPTTRASTIAGDAPQSRGRPGADPSHQMLAGMFPLTGAADDGSYSETQVQQLLQVIESTQRYGKEIEQSVEELAELLRRKTIECDGLRQIAQENYDPLRHAVRNEYNSRVKQESRHAQEQRALQRQIETLKLDRTKLQQELDSLRKLVQELQSVPPAVQFDPQSDTLLNRMFRDGSTGTLGDPYAATMRGGSRPLPSTLTGALDGSASAQIAETMYMSGEKAMTSPEQRDFVNYIMSLGPDNAKALHNSGALDLVKVVCRRLCQALPDGSYPDLGSTAGDVLRDLRNGANLGYEASQPLRALQPSWRQRCTQLFLANRPGQGRDLAALLDEHSGREEELYRRLKSEFEADHPPNFEDVEGSPTGTMQPLSQRLNSYQNAMDAKAGAQSIQATQKNTSVEDRELHARCLIMYRKYNPSKATSKEVQDMFRKYPPDVLLAALIEKYGPEPTASERKYLVRSLMEEAEKSTSDFGS